MLRAVKALLAFIVAVVIVGASIIGGTNAYVVVTTKDDIVSEAEAAAFQADCIVVLGAAVTPEEEPSGILEDRLDQAIALYQAGASPRIIMSGNQEPGYDEPSVMKQYAVDRGVPSDDVFCDYAGYNTYDTMYRAANVFGAQRAVVVTQTYHLYRALYAAQGLGMEALGVPSDFHEYDGQDYYDLREVGARTKDFFQVWAKVPATELDAPVSLEGNGDDSDAQLTHR